MRYAFSGSKVFASPVERRRISASRCGVGCQAERNERRRVGMHHNGITVSSFDGVHVRWIVIWRRIRMREVRDESMLLMISHKSQ